MRQEIADLLDAVADDDRFDEQKYRRLLDLLHEVPKDRLLGLAADELTDYYAASGRGTLIGSSTPNVAELRDVRENLRVFARAIREDITEFRSLSDLRRRLLTDKG